jgi:hypothetical protein
LSFPSKATLKEFVVDNFSMKQNEEFEEWTPTDWQEHPEYLEKLRQKPLIYVGLEVSCSGWSRGGAPSASIFSRPRSTSCGRSSARGTAAAATAGATTIRLVLLHHRCSEDLQKNPDLYSIIWLPNGFVMPGGEIIACPGVDGELIFWLTPSAGRFREIYYWDSYWILRGMIVSRMHKTVKAYLAKTLTESLSCT